jgi:beta-galactosidase/beta-glucuronidase
MTDTEVKLNGKSAGAIHQGSFYRFKYDISSLLNYGKPNLLEVTVSKQSANASVNAAERKADFWVFGGIFRPVFLEAFPKAHIKLHYAIDAKANGKLTAAIKLASVKSGTITGQVYTLGTKSWCGFWLNVNAGDTLVNLTTNIASPKLWSPEFPNLYNVVFTLNQGGKTVHTVKQRFGFRTVELRLHDGIYVNNVKIKFKGVNRHSFWPTTGRAHE